MISHYDSCQTPANFNCYQFLRLIELTKGTNFVEQVGCLTLSNCVVNCLNVYVLLSASAIVWELMLTLCLRKILMLPLLCPTPYTHSPSTQHSTTHTAQHSPTHRATAHSTALHTRHTYTPIMCCVLCVVWPSHEPTPVTVYRVQ